MCFSPEADFTVGAVVAGVGVQTLRRVRAPREVLIASLPLLLGAHQLVEGFVWLWLQGRVSGAVGATAREAYIVFAHAVLPAAVPIGFLLLEPDPRRRRWLGPFALAGGLLGVYLLWQVTAYPVGAQVQARCIDYTTHAPNDVLLTAVYVLVTCGPALLSSRRYLRWFGVLNLVGVAVAAAVRAEELTSVWCAYAAFVSVLILVHFRRQRVAETRGSVGAVDRQVRHTRAL
jgi:hypothetical protein